MDKFQEMALVLKWYLATTEMMTNAKNMEENGTTSRKSPWKLN